MDQIRLVFPAWLDLLMSWKLGARPRCRRKSAQFSKPFLWRMYPFPLLCIHTVYCSLVWFIFFKCGNHSPKRASLLQLCLPAPPTLKYPLCLPLHCPVEHLPVLADVGLWLVVAGWCLPPTQQLLALLQYLMACLWQCTFLSCRQRQA